MRGWFVVNLGCLVVKVEIVRVVLVGGNVVLRLDALLKCSEEQMWAHEE